VLALWFDKWDETAYADRQAILDDESNPGKNDVQRDLRRIANELDAARAAPQADAGTLREALYTLAYQWDSEAHRRETAAMQSPRENTGINASRAATLRECATALAALAASSPATAGREENNT
jgi:hypothetical protein